MRNYPKTAVEMWDRLSTDEACRSYLAKLRWPDGTICPACGSKEVWVNKPPLNRCASCKHDFSVSSGTLFARTNKSLRLWFEAIWDITNQKSGASALGLQKTLGLGSYQTAWNWPLLTGSRHCLISTLCWRSARLRVLSGTNLSCIRYIEKMARDCQA
jgi:transposase-like protein